MHDIKNHEIARVFLEISEYLQMQDIPFKPRAYEKVSEIVGALEESVVNIYKDGGLAALEKIPGVGISIAEKIEELLKTGKCQYHEDLKKEVPVDLSALTRVESLGPKNIKKLYKELGIKNLHDLEGAALSHKIRDLAGFGQKSEEKILRGIEFLKRSGGRFVLGFIMPQVLELKEYLAGLPAVLKIEVAGSVRRRKETIGDVDILVVSSKPASVMDSFVGMKGIAEIMAHGETKSAVKLMNGLNIDLRVVEKKSYGSALNYFTGSKDHNVQLRELAIKKGLKLNEYGLFRGEKQIAGETEEEIYDALGLHYIEPELRENTGEIEAARLNALPKIINYNDLRGDLQVQSNWTDGAHSIETMAEVAIKYGLKYIAITDHTKRLAMTGGLDEKRLLKQIMEIDRLNKKLKGRIRILKGSECDILKDGRLDLSDEALLRLDVVGASVHSYFNLPRKAQTERVITAMRNKNVDILFHPTGRVINKRDAYDIDMGEIIKVAKETGTVLEIDSFPDRADLKDEYIRQAVSSGVRLSIDSDAHSSLHFSYLEWGVAQARRGWATAGDIINTRSCDEMLGLLK